jgi:hypothetical protein
MKKSLVKYIISSQKENDAFEDRLSEIFSRNLSSETSLEVLCFGIPSELVLLDATELMKAVENKYTNTKVKCDKILGIDIASDFRIYVRYEMSQRRWFSTEDARNSAVENKRRYDGVGEKDSTHTISGWISGIPDSTTFDSEELENIVKVVRK